MRYRLFRCALVAYIVLSVDVATAQDVPWQEFLPAAEGDEWVYEVARINCGRPSGPYGCTDTLSLTRSAFTVVGEESIGGDTFPVYEGSRGRCAMGVAQATGLLTRAALSGGTAPTVCPVVAQDADPFAVDEPVDADSVEVGGQTIAVPAVKTMGYGGAVIDLATYAPAIGLVHYVYDACGPTGCGKIEWTLVAARVGGERYGEFAVASESGPETAPASLDVYPHPVRGASRIALRGDADGVFELALFDVQGRHVRSLYEGRGGALTLALPTDLAAGTYVIRAAGQDWATHRVITVVK